MSVSHENVVLPMYIAPDSSYYAMEHIPGLNVCEIVESRGNFSLAKSTEVILKICEGLKFMYENFQILHRDIKPQHIIVTSEGTVKLCGFGIIKQEVKQEVDFMTAKGFIRGTPLYLAPELIMGETHSIQSDMFSLGLTWFYMLTGKELFQDPRAIVNYATTGVLKETWSQEFTKIRPLLDTLLHHQKDKRYLGYEKLIHDIQILKHDVFTQKKPVQQSASATSKHKQQDALTRNRPTISGSSIPFQNVNSQPVVTQKPQATPKNNFTIQAINENYQLEKVQNETIDYKLLYAKSKAKNPHDRIAIKIAKTNSQGFARECQLLKNLEGKNFDNIVNIHYVDPKHHYYVMEYAKGWDICEYMKNHKRAFSKKESVEIILQLAHALNFLYKNFQILHRDIKPQHIIINPEFNAAKLCGLGIIKSEIPMEADLITMRGFVKGTPVYLAPEVIQGNSHSVQSDIFSLGLTLFCMMTGIEFFENVVDAAEYLENNTVPQLIHPNIAKYSDIQECLSKMLAKEKRYRYKSYDELLEDLNTIKSQKDKQLESSDDLESVIQNQMDKIFFIKKEMACIKDYLSKLEKEMCELENISLKVHYHIKQTD